MNRPKALTLSLIIPVYNEERYIGDVLDAISSQIVKPDEVIVVDNNSTDKTIEIVKKYKFVKILHEPRQGRAYSRNTGFNYASGKILARIDGDSILALDWIERVKNTFKTESIGGISGLGKTQVVPYLKYTSTFWSRIYYLDSESYFMMPLLQGAAMAITKQTWQAVRNKTCNDDLLVHEDIDISILINGKGYAIKKDPSLQFSMDGRSFLYLPKVIEYALRRRKTKRLHKQKGSLERARQRSAIKGRIPWSQRLIVFIIGPLFVGLSIIYTLQVWLIWFLTGSKPF